MASEANPLEGIQQDKDGLYFDVVDLGDGSGPQVFKGKTVAELLGKYRQAQTHATKKIREQALALKLRDTPDPAMPVPTYQPHTPTADELWTLANDLKDPAKAAAALQRATEWQLGTSLAEVRNTIVETRRERDRQQIFAAGEAFMDAHPEYKRCKENEDAIFGYLDKNNLAYSRKNFEIAFGELRDGLILISPTQTPVTTTGTPSAPRIETPATRPRAASTGLSSRASTAVPPTTSGPTRPAKLTVAEINSMDTREYLRRVESDPLWAAEAERVLQADEDARRRR